MSYGTAESRLWVGIFFAAWVAFILVVEIVLLVMRGQGKNVPTLSIYVKDGSLFAGFAPVAYGIMGGHWFVNWPLTSKPWFTGWWVWVAAMVVVIASDAILWGRPRSEYPDWLRVVRHPGVLLLVGVALGAFCWPQRGDL